MPTLFAEHLSRYPQSAPQDLLKLAYQSEFGDDPLLDAAFLRAENPAEPIGNGLCRLHLQAAGALRLRPETLQAMSRRAVRPDGSMDGLARRLDALCGVRPDMAEAVATYRAAGCPPVLHSEAYRAAYRPCYRLMPSECARFLTLFARIDALMEEKPFVRVCIDGPCGSGKSTLGALVRDLYGAALIPIDDFFLPPELRTPERLAQPGGNIHYERFYKEVASKPRDAAIDYLPFNCAVQVVGAPVHIEPNPLLVVEGSYSQHPALRDSYDLRVLLGISPEEQSARILRRNGPAMHKRFVEEWIPLENLYFTQCRVREHADMIFDE